MDFPVAGYLPPKGHSQSLFQSAQLICTQQPFPLSLRRTHLQATHLAVPRASPLTIPRAALLIAQRAAPLPSPLAHPLANLLALPRPRATSQKSLSVQQLHPTPPRHTCFPLYPREHPPLLPLPLLAATTRTTHSPAAHHHHPPPATARARQHAHSPHHRHVLQRPLHNSLNSRWLATDFHKAQEPPYPALPPHRHFLLGEIAHVGLLSPGVRASRARALHSAASRRKHPFLAHVGVSREGLEEEQGGWLRQTGRGKAG